MLAADIIGVVYRSGDGLEEAILASRPKEKFVYLIYNTPNIFYFDSY